MVTGTTGGGAKLFTLKTGVGMPEVAWRGRKHKRKRVVGPCAVTVCGEVDSFKQTTMTLSKIRATGNASFSSGSSYASNYIGIA